MRTVALLLAAGFSRRFEGIKLTAPLDQHNTVFSGSVRTLLPHFELIVVVTRQALLDQDMLKALTPDELSHLSVVLCEEAEHGMGHSLAAGITSLTDCDAVLVCLADMPYLQADTLRTLKQSATRDHIVVPVFNGQRGNPVAFGSSLFPELERCHGDTGARDVIRQYRGIVIEVPVQDPGIFRDIDTRGDLDRNSETARFS